MGKPESFRLGEPSAAEIESAMLDVVLNKAGNDESKIRTSITEAIRDVKDQARRTYLWNLLSRKATDRIRREKRKSQSS